MMMSGTSKEHVFQFKKEVVQWVQAHGIKPAVVKWGLGRNTIRRWLRRFESEGNEGLKDKRKGPKHIPHKTCSEIEKRVIEARKQVPCYGASRLKYFFELKCSKGAINRILKENGLLTKKKKKYQTKNDLREVKAKYKAFGHVQMDVKYLRDIPNYWGQMKQFQLPHFQYTIRDTKSGMLFLGFSDELSELTARTMVDYVLARLRAQMPEQEIIVQTDNGVEFSGTVRHFEKAPFSQQVSKYEARHVFIPPKMCNANGDVESIHNTIEKEFFDLTAFQSREDFIKKAETYRLFYNLERPNSYKGMQPPWLIAQQDWSDSQNVASHIVAIQTVDLDKMTVSQYNIGGPGIHGYPDSAKKMFIRNALL
jgi:transposase